MGTEDKTKPDFKDFKDLTDKTQFREQKPLARQLPEQEKPIFENKVLNVSFLKYPLYLGALWFFFGLVQSVLNTIPFIGSRFIEPIYNYTMFLVVNSWIEIACILLCLFLAKSVSTKSYFRMYSARVSFYNFENQKIRLNIDDIASIKYSPVLFRSAYFQFKNFYGDRYYCVVRRYPEFISQLTANKNFHSESKISRSLLMGYISGFFLVLGIAFFIASRNPVWIIYTLAGFLLFMFILVLLALVGKFFSRRQIVTRKHEVFIGLAFISVLLSNLYSKDLSPKDRAFIQHANNIMFFEQRKNSQMQSQACASLIQNFSATKLPKRQLNFLSKKCHVGLSHLSSQAPNQPKSK